MHVLIKDMLLLQLVNLADLTDLDCHLLQEPIYCPTADCTTGITLPAVLNRFGDDTNKI
jgi:hypothetical protein